MALTLIDTTGSATRGFEFVTGTLNGAAIESTEVKYGQRAYSLDGSGGLALVYYRSGFGDAGRRGNSWIKWTADENSELLHLKNNGNGTFVFSVDRVSSGVLSFRSNTGGLTKNTVSTFPSGTYYRISWAYVITSTTNFTFKLWVDGTLALTVTDVDGSLDGTGGDEWQFAQQNTANKTYVTGFVVDDSTALTDIGDIRAVPALYASESTTNFDTAIGNARSSSDYNNVNERPLSESNGWQHAATSVVEESYGIQQTLSSLDVDITGKTVVGRLAWLWSKKGSNTFTPCTYRAAIAGTGNTTTGGTLVIPASTATGDLLVCAVTSQGSTSGSSNVTCTDNDSGGNTWTTVTNTADKKAWLFAKRATSATASKTITIANGVTKTAFNCVVFKDAATSLTVLNTIINVTTESNASGDETHATFTPNVGGCAIGFSIHDYGSNNAASSQSTASLGAMTERAEHLPAGAGADCANSISTLDGTAAAAAATGSITWAQTDSTTYSIAFAVRPESTWADAAAKLINNGSDVSITLTTTSALYSALTTSATYPSSTFGMKSTGNDEDTFFYEGGVLIAYDNVPAERQEWMGRFPAEKSRSPMLIGY